MKCVIMAGGKGTRISAVANNIPKPMIKIADKPVLEHEIDCLREQGFTNIIITVSHLGEVIMDYFGDGSKISPTTGKSFGVNIEYYFEKEPLGNAGALYEVKHLLTEDFLLLNADSLFNVDFNRMVEYHQKHGAWATLFTHPNNHPYDSGLIIADEENRVVRWLAREDERPEYYNNRVNAGLHILNLKVLENRPDTMKVDLDRQILKPLAGTGKMVAYDSPEYVKDMGTPERYAKVCDEWQSGFVKKRNLLNKQKAIFIDRDGTINEYVGFLKHINEFRLIPGVVEAIKKINESGYLAIVVTNQPVIARGEVTREQLAEIHRKMETLLGNEGAYIDGLFYCPHHPDKGFEGEIPELKIDCECRKPKPGMLIKAAEKFNIELSESWMIGDGKNDIKAGKTAGCKTALIGKNDYGQDLTVDSLLDFVQKEI